MSTDHHPDGYQWHRRSDRYHDGGAETNRRRDTDYSLPEDEAHQEPQWSRQQPDEDWAPARGNAASDRQRAYLDAFYGNDRYQPRQLELEDEEEEYERERRRFPWVQVLLGVLLAAVVLAVGLHFLDNAGPLTPLKRAVDGLIGVQPQ